MVRNENLGPDLKLIFFKKADDFCSPLTLHSRLPSLDLNFPLSKVGIPLLSATVTV